MIAGLWVLSIVGSWCNFFTFFYIGNNITVYVTGLLLFLHWYFLLKNRSQWFFWTVFVLLHTVPVLYEKYEDRVDPIAEKAVAEIKKQYAVFDEKVLSKIPRGPLKDDKKMA